MDPGTVVGILSLGIQVLMGHLDLAIQVLLLHNSASTGDVVAEIADGVEDIEKLVTDIQTTTLAAKARTESVAAGVQVLLSREQSKQLYEVVDWLGAPDQTINHDEARRKHEPGTGAWFLKSQSYQEWLSGLSSRLWLHGKAGCCKTVLCSTIIEDVQRQLSTQAGVVLVYFYFSFADMRKQSYTSLLLSLVTQLVQDSADTPPRLLSTFKRNHTPDIRVLEEALIALLRKYRDPHVIIDALDECPETGDEREGVMQGLERITKAAADTRILITSRKESDIEEHMQTWTNARLAVDGQCVNADIDVFVESALAVDPKLKRLPDKVKSEIKHTFHVKSDGMFRWAALQLQSIKNLKILRPSYISVALSTMPRSLDETYERILIGIDDLYHDEVRVALQWLTFSETPLSVVEVAEACSIHLDDVDNPFIEECSEDTLSGLLSVLSPLILIEQLPLSGGGYPTVYPRPAKFSAARQAQRVRLAHFSVKEYLLSSRLQNSRVFHFALSEESYYHLAQMCCAYLLALANEDEIQSWIEKNIPMGDPVVAYWHSVRDPHYLDYLTPSYPLLPHAVSQWTRYQALAEAQPITPRSDMQLHVEFFRNDIARISWLRLGDFRNTRRFGDFHYGKPLDWSDGTKPLYWSSLFRFDRTIAMLAEKDPSLDVNHIGGIYGTALQAAAYSGADKIVDYLINRGADVNTQAGCHGTALEIAAHRGHEKIVEILILAGAQGTDGGAISNAARQKHEIILSILVKHYGASAIASSRCLVAASWAGNERIMQILLTPQEVDVNANEAHFKHACTPLEAASCEGHETIVQMLLLKGADVNAPGCYHGSALIAAATKGRKSVVKMLIENRADVNCTGFLGPGRVWQTSGGISALQAAAAGGYESIVQLLLAQNASVNSQGGEYDNALYAASYKGHARIVKLLLDKGATVDAEGGHYHTPLQAASYAGHTNIVKALLAENANVNLQVGYYGNALYTGSYGGNERIVRLLLDKGADPNLPAGYDPDESPLAAAAGLRRMQMVRMLLESGAEITSKAIMAASRRGDEEIVQLFLDQSAGIDLSKGLWAASHQGHYNVVQMLLSNGADPHNDEALVAASARGHYDIIHFLLNKGADPNNDEALWEASHYGRSQIVQVLLDGGAVADGRGKDGERPESALETASSRGHHETVQILLSKGADPNNGEALWKAMLNGYDQTVQVLSDGGASARGALRSASIRGKSWVVELLLDIYADANHPDVLNDALQEASDKGHEDVVQILLDRGATFDD